MGGNTETTSSPETSNQAPPGIVRVELMCESPEYFEEGCRALERVMPTTKRKGLFVIVETTRANLEKGLELPEGFVEIGVVSDDDTRHSKDL